MDSIDIEAFLANSKAGKLSTQDRSMVNSAKLSTTEKGRDLLDSISPTSLKELQRTIDETKDAKIKQVLLDQQKQAVHIRNQLQLRALTQILPDFND